MKFEKTSYRTRTNFRLIVGTLMVFLLVTVSCNKKIVQLDSRSTDGKEAPMTSNVQVYQDGSYKGGLSNEDPVPIQGKPQFYRDVYMNMRYPAKARENGTQGKVWFELSINESGQVTDMVKVISVSPELDAEAEKGIRRGTKDGFEPYEFDGKFVKIKYLVNMNFRLE